MEEDIRYEYTERSVSAWGGMRWMQELLARTKIREELEKLPLPRPGSNRGYTAVQILESFWVSVWIGASRFSHSGWLRYDKVLGEIFHGSVYHHKVPIVDFFTSLVGSATRKYLSVCSDGFLSN